MLKFIPLSIQKCKNLSHLLNQDKISQVARRRNINPRPPPYLFLLKNTLKGPVSSNLTGLNFYGACIDLN